MNRVRLVVLAAACLAVTGCVEGETTVTVNPDGSAKLHFDVVSGMPINFDFGPPGLKKDQEESLDDLVRKAIKPTLEKSNVAAWKDVSATFLPNGKLKFTGTAYVKKLDDFKSEGSLTSFAPTGLVTREPSGALVLTGKKKDNEMTPSKRQPKTPEQIRKMSDAELDKLILRDLIELQSMKPLLTAFLTDAKITTTFILPGEVTAATGYIKDGNKASMTIDGAKILKRLNEITSMDTASLRKLYRSAEGPVPDSLFLELSDPERGSITVGKPGQPLFDYDKEVAAARAAYPELRKKFGFGADLKLPGETPSIKR